MNGAPAPAELAIVFIFYGFIFLFLFGVQLFVCWLLYKAALPVPATYLDQSPGTAFLLLIPLFNIVWLFIFTRSLSVGYQRHFHQSGTLTDDCGQQLGMWWGICAACSLIPCIGMIPAAISFVIMILYLAKVYSCRSQLLGMTTPGYVYGTNGEFSTPTAPTKNPYSY